MKTLFTFLLFSLCLSAQQPWSGILNPTRAVNWSNAGVVGGIPTNRNTICSSLTSGASLASINAAIAACPSGEVVSLGAGTYTVAGSILFNNASNVTLRGAGPNSTVIKWTAMSSCYGIGGNICIVNGDNESGRMPSNTANWTAGYTQGATSITLSSTTNLQVGSLLVLYQLDDASDTGNMYVCQTSGSNGDCSQQGGVSNGAYIGGAYDAGGNQQVTVTSISGNTVGITPGLYAPNWRSSQNPGAWWSSNLPITGVGIENLTVDFRGSNGSGVNFLGMEFFNATNSWVKNVRSLNDLNGVTEHIEFYQSSHITVRDSYFFGSNPSSEGYGVECGFSSSDTLVENNVLHHIASPLVTQGCIGSVFDYNFSVDDFFGPGTWNQEDGHHSVGDAYLLFEGNESVGFNGDTIHGTSNFLTFFRDYMYGLDPATVNGVKNQATWAMFPFAYSRYWNVVGSVLGTQSYHTIYTTQAASSTDCGSSDSPALSVFELGFSDQNGTQFSSACSGEGFSIPNDLLVATTLMRWGNYAACTGDAACNAVRFVTSENASGAPTYPGLSSPSATMPSSFYYTSKPTWWGSSSWPAIGPDITGGTVANVGGHVNHNPAANCYINIIGGSMTGSSGALSFDANTCYSSSPAVNTPSFSPAAGTYVGTQTVTISDTTPSAVICYTTNGSAPTAPTAGTCGTGSTTYSGVISVSATETIEALGTLAANLNSSVASALYTISSGTAATPTFSPVAGTYSSAQTVTISSSTSGAVLCYTTTGVAPTAPTAGTCGTGSTTYSGTVSVSASETIEALATKATYTNSSIATAAYVINGTIATPTFSPVAGSYSGTQTVSITSATSGVAICYTTSGTTPAAVTAGTCSTGTQITNGATVSIASTETLKAIGTSPSFTNSAVETGLYTITPLGIGGVKLFGPSISFGPVRTH